MSLKTKQAHADITMKASSSVPLRAFHEKILNIKPALKNGNHGRHPQRPVH